MSIERAVVSDVLRVTSHIPDDDIRAKYILKDLSLRGYALTGPHVHEWADNTDWDGGPSDLPVRQCVSCNAVSSAMTDAAAEPGTRAEGETL